MNGTEVSNYVIALGKAVGNPDLFLSYGYIVNTTGQIIGGKFQWTWDGMRIVDKVAFRAPFNDSDRFYVPVRKHRELVLTYINNMYTLY